jgi:uncharacterized repeat protein (TIGR01451 family)
MEIQRIGMDTTKDGDLHFYPICTSDRGPMDFCTGVQESHYTYLWDFGDGRYSLESNPIMRFTHNPPTRVRLLVGGLKTIKDPDLRLLSPVESNCFAPDTIKAAFKIGRADRDYAETKAMILRPSHPPVAGMCAEYLLSFDFASACKYTGQFDLKALGNEQRPQSLVSIQSCQSSPGVTTKIVDGSNLHIEIDRTKNDRVYVLLHCQFSPLATIKDVLVWQLTGNFVPVNASQSCGRIHVSLNESYAFQSALDPSELTTFAKRNVMHGEEVRWQIAVRNDGNMDETNVTIIDTLPMQFNPASLKIHSTRWGGKDIEPVMKPDGKNRIFIWELSNEADPLKPGEYAELQFSVTVDEIFNCPDGYTDGSCFDKPTTGRQIIHRLWTEFGNEKPKKQYLLEYNALSVLCQQACKPEPQPGGVLTARMDWLPVIITIVLAAIIIVFLSSLLMKARKRRKA